MFSVVNYSLWLLGSAGMLLTTDIFFDVRIFRAIQLNVKIVLDHSAAAIDLCMIYFHFSCYVDLSSNH